MSEKQSSWVFESHLANEALQKLHNNLVNEKEKTIQSWIWDYSRHIDSFSQDSWHTISNDRKLQIIRDLSWHIILKDLTTEIRSQKIKEIAKKSLEKLEKEIHSHGRNLEYSDTWVKDQNWKPIMIDNKSSSLIKMSIPELAAAWYSVMSAIWAVANALWWNWDMALALWAVSWWTWKLTMRTIFWKDIPMPVNPTVQSVLKDNNLVYWYFSLFISSEDSYLYTDKEGKKWNINLDFVTKYFDWFKWDSQNGSWRTYREEIMSDINNWLDWDSLKSRLISYWLIKQDTPYVFLQNIKWDNLSLILKTLFWRRDNVKNLNWINNFNDICAYIKDAWVRDILWSTQTFLRKGINLNNSTPVSSKHYDVNIG